MLQPAYVAGIVDGEGSIAIGTRSPGKNHQARLTICNSHLPLLKQIQKEYGGNLSPRRNKIKPHHKQTYNLQWSGNIVVKEFLDKIFMYLVIKRAQAEFILVQWLPSFTGVQRRKVSQEELNRRDLFVSKLKEMKKENFPLEA
jgi:hypothetical protein